MYVKSARIQNNSVLCLKKTVKTVEIVFQGLRRVNYKSNIDQCFLQSFFIFLNKTCLVNNFLVKCQIIFRFSRKIFKYMYDTFPVYIYFYTFKLYRCNHDS